MHYAKKKEIDRKRIYAKIQHHNNTRSLQDEKWTKLRCCIPFIYPRLMITNAHEFANKRKGKISTVKVVVVVYNEAPRMFFCWCSHGNFSLSRTPSPPFDYYLMRCGVNTSIIDNNDLFMQYKSNSIFGYNWRLMWEKGRFGRFTRPILFWF